MDNWLLINTRGHPDRIGFNYKRALAFAAQAIFDSPDVSQETKDRIRAWGEKLLAATERGIDQMTPGRADDRVAQRGATLASWSAVTGNKELFSRAMQKYWKVVSRISATPTFVTFAIFSRIFVL